MTPMGSFRTLRRETMPIFSELGSGRSHSNSSIMDAGYSNASSSGQSNWAANVSMRGVPTSATSSSRYSSRSDSSAACSCSMQRLRNEWLVDQSVSSKARRAAPMARCMSSAEASATSPSTSSVAGLTFSNRLPDAALDELAVDQHADFTLDAILVSPRDLSLARTDPYGIGSCCPTPRCVEMILNSGTRSCWRDGFPQNCALALAKSLNTGTSFLYSLGRRTMKE